jgi:hypothetical protein
VDLLPKPDVKDDDDLVRQPSAGWRYRTVADGGWPKVSNLIGSVEKKPEVGP